MFPGKAALSLILGLALLSGSCLACGGRLVVGEPPWAVGIRGEASAGGATGGIEIGGWLFGLSLFLDVGPLEDDDEDALAR